MRKIHIEVSPTTTLVISTKGRNPQLYVVEVRFLVASLLEMTSKW